MTQLPGITLRPAEAGDLAQIVNLDRLSFAPLSTNAEIEREWYGQGLDLPDRSLFIAEQGMTGLAVGSYAQLRLGICFEGQVLPAMGISAVAVAPHFRGKRLAQLLVEHALETGQAQQLPLMMLYPFQHGFYRKLGWAWVGRSHQYRVAARHLPGYTERSHIVPYDPFQHEPMLQAIYQRQALQHNGWLKRWDWQWQSRVKPVTGREIYCYAEAGEPLGYVVVQFARLEPPQNILAAIVQEWVATTPAAYRGILGFLASLRDQVSTIVWNTYADDPFPHLLREQRRDPTLLSVPSEFGWTHRFGTINAGFMWRLVDLEAAFRLRPIAAHSSFKLTFQLTDPILDDRTITADFADGKMHPASQPASTVITTSIEHLTELFCGFRRSRDLLWTGELEVEGDRSLLANLDSAWAATSPFCWDFF
ncbi:MAG: GNAT family N-acetyltransferase [Tildeniella nuda ZEHNDER 1965/U140]|jgi:predicted acetyltransferase|nr:GNAT family N-acetyltransferase [Tildeniella nuda ZEHNDER 1965/U140]